MTNSRKKWRSSQMRPRTIKKRNHRMTKRQMTLRAKVLERTTAEADQVMASLEDRTAVILAAAATVQTPLAPLKIPEAEVTGTIQAPITRRAQKPQCRSSRHAVAL